MMTFKEYLNTLSENALKRIANYPFVDVESADGYKHYTLPTDEKFFDTRLLGNSCLEVNHLLHMLFCFMLNKDKNGKFIYEPELSLEERHEILYNMLLKTVSRHSAYRNNLLYCLPLKYVRKLKAKDIEPRSVRELTLEELLLFTSDFSNIHWNHLDLAHIYGIGEIEMELIPKDILKPYVKENGLNAFTDISKLDINNELFDEMFFGEDGWTEQQKADIFDRYYKNDESSFNDFLKRIVCADTTHTYIRKLNKLFDGRSTIYSYLYNLKKPEDELAKCKKKDKYRYSKTLRQLIWAIRCCNYNRLTTADCRKLGDLAPILKMYGKNWDTLMNMLYPVTNTVNNQTTQEDEHAVCSSV